MNHCTESAVHLVNPDALETSINDTRCSHIYYCNPMRSGQKGSLEQAHTMLRMFLPKGTSFKFLTQ